MSEPLPTAPAPAAKRPPWVRMAIDYAGAVAFLAGFIITRDLQKATWFLVAASAAALVAGYALERRIAPMPLIYGGAALLFGTLTLVFHDPRFVKMKTTFVDLALGSAMLIGLRLGKSPIKLIVGDALKLSEDGWRALTLRFGIFFLALAALNEVVWRTQPDAVWLLLRFPGYAILTFLFAFTQAPMMMKEAKRLEAAANAAESQN